MQGNFKKLFEKLFFPFDKRKKGKAFKLPLQTFIKIFLI
jgi:hypothetical protein